MVLRGFLAERDGGNSEDLVEGFFRHQRHCHKLRATHWPFPKEALYVEEHPMEDYETSPSLLPVFPGGEGPANHSAVLELSIKPGDGPKGPSTASTSDAEIPAVADWSREGRVEQVALFFCSGVNASNWDEAPISVKAPLNDVLFLEILKTYPDQTVAKAAEQPCDATCGTFSQENAGLAFFDSRIDLEEKSRWSRHWTSPPRRRNSNDWRKKDDYVFLPLVLRPSKTRSFFQNSTRTRASWQKGPALWEEDDRSRTLETGTWPPMVNDSAKQGICPIPALPGVPKSAAQEKYLLQLVHHHRKLVGGKKEDPLKEGFLNGNNETVCFGFPLSFFLKMWESFGFFLCFEGY
ncbi:hypothetical protein GWK47_024638 [Chionoecetes opilio]|uniref:Uncharacterized protein n=1 Tax=Chionoecetes opilio TaxID=41210 RepID=A0A8J4XNA9_CHIOP|nr:hypothetical protein GWK47_024638 [Chionoecetes opilio]